MKLKRAGIATVLIIVVLLVYAIGNLINLHGRVQQAELRKAELKAQVADITAANDEMQYAIDHRYDDSVMEGIARGEGFIYQGEEVYYAE